MFVFSLQSLLEYRRSTEEAARARFARCRSTQNEAVRTLSDLQHGLRRLASEETDAARLQCCANGVEGQRRIVAGCLREYQAAKHEFAQAAAARCAVETLRDWRYAAFRARRERRYAAELDDSNLLRGHSPS